MWQRQFSLLWRFIGKVIKWAKFVNLEHILMSSKSSPMPKVLSSNRGLFSHFSKYSPLLTYVQTHFCPVFKEYTSKLFSFHQSNQTPTVSQFGLYNWFEMFASKSHFRWMTQNSFVLILGQCPMMFFMGQFGVNIY